MNFKKGDRVRYRMVTNEALGDRDGELGTVSSEPVGYCVNIQVAWDDDRWPGLTGNGAYWDRKNLEVIEDEKEGLVEKTLDHQKLVEILMRHSASLDLMNELTKFLMKSGVKLEWINE